MDYCVYLTTYSGNLLPPKYIGSTSVDKIKKGYKGSVCSKKYKSIWISELKNNLHYFDIKILSYHKTREEAYEEEHRLLKDLNVIASSEYINQNANRGLPSRKGIKLSKEHKEKVSAGVKLSMTQGVKDSISSSLIGTHRPQEVKDKISKSHTEKIISEETKKKQKQRTTKQSTKDKQSLAKINKKTGPCSLKRKTAISKAKLGKNSHGKYSTPWGIFDSAKLASIYNNVISEDAIRFWCKNSNKKISNQTISAASHYLNRTMVGKTFYDIGFDFIPK